MLLLIKFSFPFQYYFYILIFLLLGQKGKKVFSTELEIEKQNLIQNNDEQNYKIENEEGEGEGGDVLDASAEQLDSLLMLDRKSEKIKKLENNNEEIESEENEEEEEEEGENDVEKDGSGEEINENEENIGITEVFNLNKEILTNNLFDDKNVDNEDNLVVKINNNETNLNKTINEEIDEGLDKFLIKDLLNKSKEELNVGDNLLENKKEETITDRNEGNNETKIIGKSVNLIETTREPYEEEENFLRNISNKIEEKNFENNLINEEINNLNIAKIIDNNKIETTTEIKIEKIETTEEATKTAIEIPTTKTSEINEKPEQTTETTTTKTSELNEKPEQTTETTTTKTLEINEKPEQTTETTTTKTSELNEKPEQTKETTTEKGGKTFETTELLIPETNIKTTEETLKTTLEKTTITESKLKEEEFQTENKILETTIPNNNSETNLFESETKNNLNLTKLKTENNIKNKSEIIINLTKNDENKFLNEKQIYKYTGQNRWKDDYEEIINYKNEAKRQNRMIEMINRQKNEGIVVERCQPKVDVVFLLDSNNNNDNIDKIYIEHVRWAISLMESLPLEHDAIRVAAAKYLGFPLTEFSLGEDIRQKLQFQQTFRTGYALRKAESELFRQDRETRKDAAKVIIIFTNNPNIFNEIMLEHKLNEIKDFKIFIASIIDIKTNNSNFDENNVFSQKELPQLRESILTEAERARACSRIGDEAFNGQRRNGPSTNQNIGKASNGGAFALAENRDRLNNNIGESNDNNFVAEAFLQQRRIEAAEMLGIDEEGNEEINKLNKNEEGMEEQKNFGKSFEVKGNENTQIEEEFNNKMSQNSKQDEQDISIDGEQALLFNNAAAFKIPSLINADELDVFDPLENSKQTSQIRRPFTGVTIDSITTPSFQISRYRPILGLSSFTKKPLLLPSSSSFLTTQKYNNYTTTTTLATTTNKLPKTFPVKVELPVAIAQRLRPTPSIEFFFEFNNEGEQQNKQLLKLNSMLEMINKIKKINREEAEKSKKEEVNNLKNNFRLNKFTKTTNQPVITTTAPKILFTTKILKNLIPNKNLTETTKTTQKYKILPTTTTTKTTTEFYTIQQPPTTKNNYLIPFQQKPKTFGITQQRVVCPPLDILFIVDSSGSVHKIYETQKEWLQHLLENIELNDDLNENKINLNQLCGHRVALIQFASSDLQKIEWEWDHFRKNWQMMENFHKNVRHITGTTYIGQALKQALKLLEERRRQVPIIVVLLSDGFSQDDAIKQAEAIRNLPNLQFYALSIGQLSNIELLHRLVDNPSHVFIGNEASELLRSQLLRRIRCN